MSPETRTVINEAITRCRAVLHPVKGRTESLRDQLARRREAALRMPPLACGHRDPMDCRDGR